MKPDPVTEKPVRSEWRELAAIIGQLAMSLTALGLTILGGLVGLVGHDYPRATFYLVLSVGITLNLHVRDGNS